jgi:sulfite reductase alpha subunit-like flavoprotein
VLQKDVYFICTGTGIAPFRSMLNYINQHQLEHRQIYLLFGTR